RLRQRVWVYVDAEARGLPEQLEDQGRIGGEGAGLRQGEAAGADLEGRLVCLQLVADEGQEARHAAGRGLGVDRLQPRAGDADEAADIGGVAEIVAHEALHARLALRADIVHARGDLRLEVEAERFLSAARDVVQ